METDRYFEALSVVTERFGELVEEVDRSGVVHRMVERAAGQSRAGRSTWLTAGRLARVLADYRGDAPALEGIL